VHTGDLALACFCDDHVVCRRLRWLSACVNPLGLEVVPIPGGRCTMRLCNSADT
jgi:hypothetical protein